MRLQNEIETQVKQYLVQYEGIVFAMIYGSYASGKMGNLSDLDIAIFCKNKIDLISFGKMIVDIEKLVNTKVDLIEINNLFTKSPVLAYRIITNHKLLFSKNDDDLIKFKRNTFLSYFETERLRQSVNSTLYKRISSKKFGKRNYA